MRPVRFVVALLVSASSISPSYASDIKRGSGGTEVTGSAGGDGQSSNANKDLPHCDAPMGTVALVEEQNPGLAQAGLTSPVPLIRLMVQQSNCFRVVDRGQAMERIQQERALAAGGMLQGGSNMGGGQMKAADYMITPNIIFQDNNAGGGGGGMGGLIPGVGGLLGGVSFKKKQVQTMLTLTNVRTGEQEIAAEGSAKKTDLGFMGGGVVGLAGGIGGAYASTDIGKLATSAFLDAYIKVVDYVRQLPPLPTAAAPAATEGTTVLHGAGGVGMAPVVTGSSAAAPMPGQTYKSRMAATLREGPEQTAKAIANLPMGVTVRPTGDVEGSWWVVEYAGKTGWVPASSVKAAQ